MKRAMFYFAVMAFFAFSLTVASSAFASCDDMGNDEWNFMSTQMAQAYDQGNYEEALKFAKRLSLICNNSPIVNFTIGEIYNKMGNETDSYAYIKRASENIMEFPVPQSIAERIWMRRAEMELPYKSQVTELQKRLDSIETDEASYLNVKTQYDELLAKTREDSIRNAYLLQKAKDNWYGALWSGVGITGVGVVLTITGGVLIAKSEKVETTGAPSADNSGFAIKKGYVAGWSLLGAGLVATVGGAVLTGIAGYKYADIDINQDGEKNESISFSVLPTAASFSMTF